MLVGLAAYPTCLICRQPPPSATATIAAVVSATPVAPVAETSPSSPVAFSGYRWPAEVILAGMRWYLRYPLSARQVAELLAERGVDVSARTVLTCRILEIISPAGFEHWFDDLGEGPRSAEEAHEHYGVETDPDGTHRICQKFGLRFPPPPHDRTRRS